MGYGIFSFSVVTSTNDVAKKLLENRSNVLVTAKLQIKGRGRNNKQWVGDEGKNIYLSIGKEHGADEGEINLLMLTYQCAGCLAVLRVLEKNAPQSIFALKYPNDIYGCCKDSVFRKISGVLVENEFLGNHIKTTVLGIGINVTQKDFAPEIQASSLLLMGIAVQQDNLLTMIITEIENLLRMPHLQVIEEWKEKLNIESKQIEIAGEEGNWDVVGFDDFGMLVVRKKDVIKTISNGDSIRYQIG